MYYPIFNKMNRVSKIISNVLNPTPSKFAVVITEKGNSMLYIKKFRRLMDKFPGLIQNSNDNLSLKELEYGDVVLFGSSSSYDYTILEGKNKTMKLKNTILYDVTSESDRIARALEHYTEKNSICPCFRKRATRRCNDDVDIFIITESKPKPRIIESYDVADIYDGFVKIGWNIYYTYTGYAGRQFVNVEGTRHQIKEDRCGNKYLA
jgi:hypothetical protein